MKARYAAVLERFHEEPKCARLFRYEYFAVLFFEQLWWRE
jgi:hypothetical protein